MADLLTMIANVDDVEIEQVVKATIKRYRELFPDWEIRIVSLEKAKDRNTQLDREIAILQRLKEFPIEENPYYTSSGSPSGCHLPLKGKA